MPYAKGRPITVENRERAREAVDLKIMGLTWAQIAKEMGYKNESAPRQLVQRYFEREANRQYDEMYPVLQERGELMWKLAYEAINKARRDGDSVKWDRAMNRGQNALAYLARINGLDNGVNVNVNVHAPADVNALRNKFFEIEQQMDAVDGEVVEDESNTPFDQAE